MASILIVEDDRRIAEDLARTMRQAGHDPIIAIDAESALQQAAKGPDIILLGCQSRDMRDQLIHHLKSRAETIDVPVLPIPDRGDAANCSAETNAWANSVPLHPVYGASLSEAVGAALRGQAELAALRLNQERQRQLIQRIIIEGSDPLVFQTCRRLSLDRLGGRGSLTREVLTWQQIADWAERERLLDRDEALLLRRLPLARSRENFA